MGGEPGWGENKPRLILFDRWAGKSPQQSDLLESRGDDGRLDGGTGPVQVVLLQAIASCIMKEKEEKKIEECGGEKTVPKKEGAGERGRQWGLKHTPWEENFPSFHTPCNNGVPSPAPPYTRILSPGPYFPPISALGGSFVLNIFAHTAGSSAIHPKSLRVEFILASVLRIMPKYRIYIYSAVCEVTHHLEVLEISKEP